MDNLTQLYDENFMKHVKVEETESAKVMMESIYHELKPRNVIDIGCGPCNHLNTLRAMDKNIKLVAVDGSEHARKYVGENIPFHVKDFTYPFMIDGGDFDLAICFEVIEHISSDFEDILINNLMRHTNKYLVISAAIPGQPGHHHVACKPLSYWVNYLTKLGFTHRTDIQERWKQEWKKKRVKFYFVDNLLVFERNKTKVFPRNMAIVGNGPAEISKGSGKTIDAFDNVLRFNNFSLDAQYQADYGTKFTHWAHCMHPNIKERTDAFQKIYVPFPVYDSRCPYKYSVNHKIFEKNKGKTIFIPYEYFNDLLQSMKLITPHIAQPKPSTGIAISYWLFREQEHYIEPKQLFGFTFFDRKYDKHEYFDGLPNWPPNIGGDLDHSGATEEKLWQSMITGIQ